MAYKLSIPFFAIRLHLSTGDTLSMPLTDPEAVHINQGIAELATQYTEQFQQEYLNKGQFLPLLQEFQTGDFFQARVVIDFPAAEGGFRYPAFELDYDYFFKASDSGYWGILPALNIEAVGVDIEELILNLQQAIRLEFTRSKRLTAAQNIIAAIWHTSVDLEVSKISLQFPTPTEQEVLGEAIQEQFLPQVARKIKQTKVATYGREEELAQLIQGLQSRFNRNLLLVGASGVGKTALVHELARQKNKHGIKLEIWETTASTLIKELMRETNWQDNLTTLCEELKGQPVILFIRNLMELFEVGQYEGNSVSIADYLHPYLTRGDVTLISECTPEELAKIELKTPNYTSIFQLLRLEEPREELESIILQKAKALTKSRRIEVTEEAIQEAIRLHRRFTPYAGFPGKPIRFIENILHQQLRNKQAQHQIDRSTIVQYFCEETGMPIFMVDPAIPMDIADVTAHFNNNIFGQQRGINSIINALASIKTALTRTEKPIASFLFVGPTGVGKTEVAKVLAEFMFGSRERLVRFDMSEYATPYDVMRLTGINDHQDGVLTAAVRREPFSVLLFDEIEKADAAFYDLLLQILDEGRLTDSRGNLVNFCSTIIIMTSNIGASNLLQNRIRWAKTIDTNDLSAHFMSAVQKHFRPELYNRMDEIVPFMPLRKETVHFVVAREMRKFYQREGIRYRPMELKIEEPVFNFIAEKGYDEKYGARQLQRVIRERLIIPLACQLNLEDFDDRLEVIVSLTKEEDIDFQISVDPIGVELYIQELDKIVNADHASELRRAIQRLCDGGFYVHLLNEVALISDRKEKKESITSEEEACYTNYSLTKQKVEQLKQEINQYELDISLACMEQLPFEQSMIDRLESWGKAFANVKTELYTRIHTDATECRLGIYGIELTPILTFYRELFALKGFQFRAQSLWCDNQFYQRSQQTEADTPYLFRAFDFDQEDAFQPPKPNATLHGVEFQVEGNCPFLYLQEEQGFQRWKYSKDEDWKYYVHIDNSDFNTPTGIHRKDFYKGKGKTPRRVIDSNHVRDTYLKLGREFQRNELPSLIAKQLDRVFELKLEVKVM